MAINVFIMKKLHKYYYMAHLFIYFCCFQKIYDSPDELINKKNCYPYIVAVGQQKDKIANYYIDIEEKLIPINFYEIEL